MSSHNLGEDLCQCLVDTKILRLMSERILNESFLQEKRVETYAREDVPRDLVSRGKSD